VSGFKIDVNVLNSLLLARSDICIHAKATENQRKRHLLVPERPWRRLSTDLSAKFDQPSIQENYY
jgi:hypothetical protein